MKASSILKFSLSIVALTLFAGCASITEEDPNSQQTPWASPAGWENNVPGMPGSGF